MKTENLKHIEVVAAIIRDEQGRIFATQRGYGGWKDWWEFPGGKIEAGETPQEALHREIREELAAEIEVGELFQTIDYDYPQFHVTMHCFLCRLKEQRQKTAALKEQRKKTATLKEQGARNTNYTLLEHEAARWLAPNELNTVRWLPADEEIIAKLQKNHSTNKEAHSNQQK